MEVFLTDLFSFYDRFLSLFPQGVHSFISFAVGVLILYAIFQILKREFIWLIVLVVLLPASVPILKQLGSVLLSLLRYVFGF